MDLIFLPDCALFSPYVTRCPEERRFLCLLCYHLSELFLSLPLSFSLIRNTFDLCILIQSRSSRSTRRVPLVVLSRGLFLEYNKCRRRLLVPRCSCADINTRRECIRSAADHLPHRRSNRFCLRCWRTHASSAFPNKKERKPQTSTRETRASFDERAWATLRRTDSEIQVDSREYHR